MLQKEALLLRNKNIMFVKCLWGSVLMSAFFFCSVVKSKIDG